METILLLIVAATLIIGAYLLVNLTASLFTKNENSENLIVYGNYNTKRDENQAYSNFQKRIIKKTIQLRNSR